MVMGSVVFFVCFTISVFFSTHAFKFSRYKFTHLTEESSGHRDNILRYFMSHEDNNPESPPHSSTSKNYPKLFEKGQKLLDRKRVADANLAYYPRNRIGNPEYVPGDSAGPFSVETLSGTLNFPGDIINKTTPLLIFGHDLRSGFSLALWSLNDSVADLIENSPQNTHYLFLSTSLRAALDAEYFKERIITVTNYLIREGRITKLKAEQFLEHVHFVTNPAGSLKNWIPDLLQDWGCQDHNCGIDQLIINDATGSDVTLPRLDARYDWLPSPQLTFGNKSLPAMIVNNACEPDVSVKGVVAIVVHDTKICSYAQMVVAMERGGAVGVVIMLATPSFPQDMNCEGAECDNPLSIPATNVPYNSTLFKLKGKLNVTFVNLPSQNFFAAIDHHGNLAEAGWFLYPTMHFLAWQAQWFNYLDGLQSQLARPALNVTVFKHTPMQGQHGASVNVTLPPLSELAEYNKVELDLQLSCEGQLDASCPHWDRTLQLHVSCNEAQSFQELGRWISPFRRRIGRWLTDVTPLFPLLQTNHCTFHMSGALPGEIWVPSLNLRFTEKRGAGSLIPYETDLIYGGSFTFDQHYNSRFRSFNFTVSSQTLQVAIVSVITGHGSDENGCGEFCVTSHHFIVNGHEHNVTFSNAGSPLGCAERVPLGVEPNEHGTWLYGRDGWCDGQEVQPWVITLGTEVKRNQTNTIQYFGLFNGRNPNPKHNPGIMTIFSYLVKYRQV